MISSAYSRTRPAHAAPYVAAKSAMETVIVTTGKEEHRHGIRANIVAPGLVDTDMGHRYVAATEGGRSFAEVTTSLPFGRACSPEDVARTVAFLVSPAGEYIMGQRIQVDGGSS